MQRFYQLLNGQKYTLPGEQDVLITFAPTGYLNESRKDEKETSAGGKFEIRTYFTRNYTQSGGDIQVLRPEEVKPKIVTVTEDSGMLAPVAGTLAGILCVLLVVVCILCRRGNEKIDFTADQLRRLSMDIARRASGKESDDKDFSSANHQRLNNDESQPVDSLGEVDKRFLGSDAVDSQGVNNEFMRSMRSPSIADKAKAGAARMKRKLEDQSSYEMSTSKKDVGLELTRDGLLSSAEGSRARSKTVSLQKLFKNEDTLDV